MNLEWLVEYRHQVRNFSKETGFYADPLQDLLLIEFPLADINQCQICYAKAHRFVKSKKNSAKQKESILCCFSLAMLYYFVSHKMCKYEMVDITTEKGEIYNPLTVCNINGYTEKFEIVLAAYSSFSSYSIEKGFAAFVLYAIGNKNYL